MDKDAIMELTISYYNSTKLKATESLWGQGDS